MPGGVRRWLFTSLARLTIVLYDASRRVRNIVLDNVTMGGKRITGPERNVLDIGPFVDAVRYQ